MNEVRSALNRTAIVEAALRRLDEGAPFSSITIRALAEELEVTPMALYRHVADKDDLLMDVIDTLLARGGLPSPDADWRTVMSELVASLREMFARQPTMVELFCRRPVATPTALARLHIGTAALERGGFSHAEAIEAYASIHIFVIGFSAVEAGRAGFAAQHPLPPAADEDSRIVANFPGDGPFQRGLRALIAGLDASRAPLSGAD
jgi:AcrR family transcriptional regulator